MTPSTPPCNVNNGIAGKCVNCIAGHYLKTDATCGLCPAGKGKGKDTTAVIAENTGTACGSVLSVAPCNVNNGVPTGCVTCLYGHYLSAVGKCTICPDGKGKPQSVSTAVDETGTGCNPYSSSPPCNVNAGSGDTCANCIAGYYLKTAISCSLCPDGFGKAKDTAVPAPDATGATCTIKSTGGCNVNTGTPSSCLNCAAGYYLKSAGVCAVCPDGKGKAVDTVSVIDALGNGCTTKSGGSEIANCKVYGAKNACAICTTGYYPAATTGATCEKCPAACVACSSATTCLYCAANHYYSAVGTCTACTGGASAPAQTETPATVQPSSTCTGGTVVNDPNSNTYRTGSKSSSSGFIMELFMSITAFLLAAC